MALFARNFLYSTFWSVFGQLGSIAVTLVANVILARILTPFEFGQLGVIMFFIVLANVFTEGGMAGALVRKEKISKEDYSTVFVFNFIVSVFLFVLMIMISGPISDFYNDPSLRNILSVSSFIIIINSLQITQNARLMREMKFKRKSLYRFVAVLISSIIGIILATKGFGVWSLVFIQLSTATFTTILLWIFEGPFFNLIFNRSSFKYLYKFGVNTTLASLLDTTFDNIYQLIIGRYFSLDQVGFFYQAKKLQEVPFGIIKSTTLGVVFSSLSSIQNEKDYFIKVYNKTTMVFTIAVGLLTVLLFTLSENIILLMYGRQWMESVIYMQLLTVASFFYLQEMFNRVIFKVFNQTHKILFLEIFKKIILSFTIILGILRLNIEILLYGLILANIISYFINFYNSRKILGNLNLYEVIILIKVVIVSFLSITIFMYAVSFFNIQSRFEFIISPLIILIYIFLIRIFGITNVWKEINSIITIIRHK